MEGTNLDLYGANFTSRKLGMRGWFTVVGHVEGGQASVGIAEHGLDGVVAVDAAPPAASLPHAVENAAYHQRVAAVLHRRDPAARLLVLLRGRTHASDRGGSPIR